MEDLCFKYSGASFNKTKYIITTSLQRKKSIDFTLNKLGMTSRDIRYAKLGMRYGSSTVCVYTAEVNWRHSSWRGSYVWEFVGTPAYLS